MSITSTYVRARDGALYQNPLFVFEEGFLCFDEEEPPELILWMPPEDRELHIKASVSAVRRRFGRCFEITEENVIAGKVSQRIVPGTDPYEFRLAMSLYVRIDARTPRPTTSDGAERYPRNCNGPIYDWPQHPLDAHELDIHK